MGTTAHNADYMKQYNRKLVMRLLISEPMSRADLARKTGLTRQTLTNIAEELLSDGIVREVPVADHGKGRTPLLLELRENAYYSIGVHISRVCCNIGLVNSLGKVVECQSIPNISKRNAAEVLETAATIAKTMAETVSPSKMYGIGLSVPGPVDIASGTILNPPRFDGWHYTDAATPFKKKFDTEVIVENNAYAQADFERCFGKGKEYENFLLLLVENGIGCGFVSRGKLYRGAHRLSGEIGHTSINFDGEKCSCGNIGCLEQYAAIPNLLKRFGYEKDDWHSIIARSEEGDSEALNILRHEADYLAAGIVNAINFLDLEAVILDGDILDIPKKWIAYMEEKINKTIITREFGNIHILTASRQPYSMVAAAGNMVFSRYFA